MVRNQRDSEKSPTFDEFKEELKQMILGHQEEWRIQQNKPKQKQEFIIEELKKINSEQLQIQKQFEEFKKIQLQHQSQKQKNDTELREDLKRQCRDIQKTVQNQTKQQGLLQNLVLDLRNSRSTEEQASAKQVETESDNKCVICLDRPLTVAVRPCGHMISCLECAKKLPPECPICRSKISDTLKIYFP